MDRVDYWNHNVHYQPLFFRTIPSACGQALDVGSGDGMLAYEGGGPGAPVQAADMTWAQVRTTARRLLPGVRYRRRLLWRYSLLWTKPGLT
jgi:2-polyprenyl-3-methyl-5-hydroxy-6-metoxy-1,4-benzoquinol methylase